MKIINVTEVINGSVESIKSFPIQNDSEENERVQKAEQNFADKAKENGASESDVEELIDNGYYSQDGYSVYLTWSDVE